jgi:3-oxoacyl-[acyl-carrier-protein] synthase II
MVGMQHIANIGQIFREQGYRRVSPHFIPMVLVNMAAGHVSLKHGLQVFIDNYFQPDKR